MYCLKCKTMPFYTVEFPLLSHGRHFLWFLICFPAHQTLSKKGSTLKGKNLLPRKAISCLLDKTYFQKKNKAILIESSTLKLYQVPSRHPLFAFIHTSKIQRANVKYAYTWRHIFFQDVKLKSKRLPFKTKNTQRNENRRPGFNLS